MGVRTNITIHASHAEERADDAPADFLQAVNAWLEEREKFGLVDIGEAVDRNTTCYVCTGCNRGDVAPEGLVEMLMAYPWNQPESVVVIVQPEEGPAELYRPKVR